MAMDSLDRDELLALLAVAKRWRQRDWLMILLAFCHGLRASEVVSLTPDNFLNGELTVQRLKGSMRTSQALHADAEPLLNLRNPLSDYLLEFARNQRIFKISRERFWQILQQHGAAAGLAKHKRHPHVLKHSIAAQTIHKAGIENVRQHLGHKSMSSTGAYLRVTDKAATAAIDGALLV